VLDELERRGFRCAAEVARQIIQEQVRDGGDALPWGDRERIPKTSPETRADFIVSLLQR
jgi:predicted ATPase